MFISVAWWAVVGAVVAVAAALWHVKCRRMERLAARLPGPPETLPFLRNALELGSTPRDVYVNIFRLCNEYGPLFKVWMGPKLHVILMDPKDIEIVVTNMKCITKGMTYDFFKPWLGTGIFTAAGEKWKKHRKLITPAFHFKILENFIDAFNSNGNILVQNLEKEVDGPSFNIYKYITLFALDVITETAMGNNVHSQRDSKSPYLEAVRTEGEIIMTRMIKPWLYPDVIFNMTGLGRLQRKALKVLHNMTKQVIQTKHDEILTTAGDKKVEESIVGKKKRVAFLDLLMQESQNGSLLSDNEIQEEVDTFMFGGHDTTTSAMCFLLWVLSIHQDVQENVFTEIESLMCDTSGEITSVSVLNDMKYLECVIKETLRLYPIGSMISREIYEELTLSGGYVLPAMTSIVIPIVMVHRNPDVYPNPEEFNPDRFLPENAVGRNPYAYIPFSAGARNCLGQRFAMLEMKATVSKILWHYKLLPDPEYQPILSVEIVLKSENGVRLKLIPRKRRVL